MYEYICRLRNSVTSSSDEFQNGDVAVNDGYLVLLNTLACINEHPQPWFLSRQYVQEKLENESPFKRIKKLKESQYKGKFNLRRTWLLEINTKIIGRSRRVLVKQSDVELEYAGELERMRVMLGRKVLTL